MLGKERSFCKLSLGILLFFSSVLSACGTDPSDVCEEEGLRECVPELGVRAFRQCKSKRWHDGSCAKGDLCVAGQCKRPEPCEKDELSCQDSEHLLRCVKGQLPQVTPCAPKHYCESGACYEKDAPKPKPSCAALAELDEEQLKREYLRHNAHCGGCDQACDVEAGQYCVLGQCVKTRCDEAECHVADAQGRMLCKPCHEQCQQIEGGGMTARTTWADMSSQKLNENNSHAEAYVYEGKWQYKVLALCVCPRSDGSEQSCSKSSDRCIDGHCRCGELGQSCPQGGVCENGRCSGSCDGLHSCASAALCEAGRCLCPNAIDKRMHCIAGMRCENGLCLCQDSGVACGGSPGTLCENQSCYCGPHKLECKGLSDVCIEGSCLCEHQGAPCGEDADSCQAGHCRCGNLPACGPNMRCVDGHCRCKNENRTCMPGEVCNSNGYCSCGGQFSSCSLQSANQCINGRCYCGKDPQCQAPHSCNGNACACGSHRACAQRSLCNEKGYCVCSSKADCHPDEDCIRNYCSCPGFYVCGPGQVCAPNNKCTYP